MKIKHLFFKGGFHDDSPKDECTVKWEGPEKEWWADTQPLSIDTSLSLHRAYHSVRWISRLWLHWVGVYLDGQVIGTLRK